MTAAIVFAAAPLAPTPRLRSRLASLEDAYVIAADAGARTALGFGLLPDLVIGDLDSVDARTLVELERAQVPVERFPRDKDATDGQLALERAIERKPAHLYLLGFLGGPRLDQFLANILLLTRLTLPTTVLDERNEARLLRASETCAWSPEPDEIVSMLPIGGDVAGVRTVGLRWPINAETLYLGDTRAISNEPIADYASVSIERGLLLLTRHFPE